jgi:hypothetical protein
VVSPIEHAVDQCDDEHPLAPVFVGSAEKVDADSAGAAYDFGNPSFAACWPSTSQGQEAGASDVHVAVMDGGSGSHGWFDWMRIYQRIFWPKTADLHNNGDRNFGVSVAHHLGHVNR